MILSGKIFFNSPVIRFFIRSRSTKDLEYRCIRLLTVIHHELYGAGQQKKTAPEKSPAPKKRKILAETNLNSINETKYKSSEIVISSDSE